MDTQDVADEHEHCAGVDNTESPVACSNEHHDHLAAHTFPRRHDDDHDDRPCDNNDRPCDNNNDCSNNNNDDDRPSG